MNVVEKARITSNRAQSIGEEWANSLSHGIGFVAALIAAPVLVLAALQHPNRGALYGAVVFMTAVLLMYFGSALYHACPAGRAKSLLQLFDHAAIFLLIGATYAPFALGPLHGPTGYLLIGVVSVIGLFGMIMKFVHGPERYTRLALALYLGMGWLGVVFLGKFAAVVPFSTIAWLVAGGVAYTIGIIFFVREHARYNHFIWHLFVLGGTTCHFWAVLGCCAV